MATPWESEEAGQCGRMKEEGGGEQGVSRRSKRGTNKIRGSKVPNLGSNMSALPCPLWPLQASVLEEVAGTLWSLTKEHRYSEPGDTDEGILGYNTPPLCIYNTVSPCVEDTERVWLFPQMT